MLAAPARRNLTYVKRQLHAGAIVAGQQKGTTAPHDRQLLEEIVAALPAFKGLPRKQLAPITRNARLQRVRRGAELARRGEPSPGVMAVGEGMLKIALHRADGAERVMRFVGPGESFGEASALLGRPSAVDAIALADSLVAVITTASLRTLVGRNASVAQRIATLLAARMLQLLTEVESSELRPAGERLAAYLLELAKPKDDTGSLTAHLPATKTLVAARLGMKKETLSRLLHDLATRRLIEVSRREIAILDRAGLNQVAGR